jgi:cytochrome oxidase Cu insertion factor (SCO1/SenC/PrrC family)
MRQSKWVLGCATMVCLWLVGSVDRVQGADPEPFAAAQLERFPRPIPLPEVSLPDPEGKKISLQSFKGQVVLMNFWTTW